MKTIAIVGIALIVIGLSHGDSDDADGIFGTDSSHDAPFSDNAPRTA